MAEKTYREPKVALNRVYTKKGDRGETTLVNGRRVAKDDLKIEVYGTIDELNAFVGMACVSARELKLEQLADVLVRVEHELFNLGSVLATDPDQIHPRQAQISDADVGKLEAEIDEIVAQLPDLPSFVLPGGCRLNAELHICRTVCRRAERSMISLSRRENVPEAALRFINRLSDAFFVWSRWASQHAGTDEVLWDPNLASSGLRE